MKKMSNYGAIAAIILAFTFVIGKANAASPIQNDLAVTNCIMSELTPSKECFDRVWSKFERFKGFVDSENHSMVGTWCTLHYLEFTLIELPHFLGQSEEVDDNIYSVIESMKESCRPYGVVF